ncbi:MAG TPA: metallophosphoesterase family protein [Abditibacteriaceae bacterium]|jgi:predicted phosphodiesterase
MRFLLLSDVHANRFGLEAALADAEGQYDQVLCLGDVVGYGAHPNECCEILRDVKAWCLRGNHDAAAIEQLDISDFNAIAAEAMRWTRRRLNIVNISWLESLKSRLDREEHGFQAVHGSIRDPLEEYILDSETAEESLALMQRPVCFYGHTHIAEFYSRSVTEENSPSQNAGFLRGGQLAIETQQRYLVNPGSCGQPRDGNPQARYALFDTVSRHLEVRALDYPWQMARAAIIEANLPRQLGDRLLLGE